MEFILDQYDVSIFEMKYRASDVVTKMGLLVKAPEYSQTCCGAVDVSSFWQHNICIWVHLCSEAAQSYSHVSALAS